MRPNPDFTGQSPEFWSVVRLLNQRLGYRQRKTKNGPGPNFMVPEVGDIIKVFEDEALDCSKLVDSNSQLTGFGKKIVAYFVFRANLLNNEVEPHLLNAAKAEALFNKLKKRINPANSLLPFNKQSGNKKRYNFLTGMVNMLISEGLGKYTFDCDPRELTAITQGNFPVRTFSRRLDGAFPKAIDPIAIWEIKEYYYTTTFGSRIADGVYETMLDGYELDEVNRSLDIKIKHYLFIDAHYTWWGMGKSYLCRLVDILHIGLVDEIIVGSEVERRIPELVKEWVAELEKERI